MPALDALDVAFLLISLLCELLVLRVILQAGQLAWQANQRQRDSPSTIALLGVAAWALSVLTNVTLWLGLFWLLHDLIDIYLSHRVQWGLFVLYTALQLGPVVGIFMAWYRITREPG